jgi:UDP-4-amino-4,6-dideoxy-N-acetyl-beta-L-altrosamine transaminase
MKMLPYGRQYIDDDDIQAVIETLRSDFLTTGPKIAEFEAALCKTTGAKQSVACSNATTALHLAALALDIKEGDCVIVPSLTFLATANAIRYAGGDVVFADVNPQTALMESHHLEEALTRCNGKAPRAVFPVHLAGQCVDMPSIGIVTKKHDLKIVTDACHAIGATQEGHSVGSCYNEDMCVFSFHSVKTVAMGEGGAITSNNDALAHKMRTLRSHGMVKRPEIGPWYYEMPEIGYNYRITDIQCALGISQLRKLDFFVRRRREIVAIYDNIIRGLPNVIMPPLRAANCDPAWHLYQVRIDFDQLGLNRTQLMNKLMEEGVGTQVHYIPVHTQPYYRDLYGNISLPGAEEFYSRTLSLPLYPSMTDDDINHVCETLTNIFR